MDNDGLSAFVLTSKRISDFPFGCVHIRSRVGRGTVARICWPVTFHPTESVLHSDS